MPPILQPKPTKPTVAKKVFVSWTLIATFCITAYSFARNWTISQRPRAVELRKQLDREFGVEDLANPPEEEIE